MRTIAGKSLTVQSLAPLFAAGFTHIQCRELCEAAAGFKVSRINLYDDQLPTFASWCREFGLVTEVSAYRVVEFVNEEGKGHWSNHGVRRSGGQGLRFCYVSLEPGQALRARQAEAESDFSPGVMGELLRIPSCCTKFFQLHKRQALAEYGDDYALLTLNATKAVPPYSWTINYLAQYFGYSLISHYPCSWDCSASLNRAQYSLKLLNGISPTWSNTFVSNLRGIVIFENLVSVHLIGGIAGDHEMSFLPHQLRSTNSTTLSRAIRRAGVIRWNSPYDFQVPGLALEDARRTETAMLIFR